ENEQRVLELLNHIHRQGRTIVMVTHNPDLSCVADRVIRLQHGKYLDEKSRHHVA
ncbi:ABC transporter ATP-binding protein, partial [Yersinia pestis]